MILHGATPDELAPVVEAYRAVRPAGRFDAMPPTPASPRVLGPLNAPPVDGLRLDGRAGARRGLASRRRAFEAGGDLAVAGDGDEVDAVERAAVPDALDVLARELDAGVAIRLDRARPTRPGCRSRGCRRSASAAIVALASTITPA